MREYIIRTDFKTRRLNENPEAAERQWKAADGVKAATIQDIYGEVKATALIEATDVIAAVTRVTELVDMITIEGTRVIDLDVTESDGAYGETIDQ